MINTNILFFMYGTYLFAMAGGLFRKVYRFPAGKPLFIYLTIETLSEIYTWIAVKEFHVNNMCIIHIDSLLDLLMFLWFYSVILESRRIKKAFPFIALLGIVIGAVEWWLLAGPYLPPSFARTCHLLMITPLPLIFFQQLLRELQIEKLRRYPLFWINTGAVIKYFGLLAVSSVMFLIHNMETGKDFRILWNINNLVTIVFNILLGIGFFIWKAPAK